MISHYFAYGSNMNPDRMTARGVTFQRFLAGRLSGFGLRFDKRSGHRDEVGHANIAYTRHGEVQGVLYHLQSPTDIVLLDVYEGSPIGYSREVFSIETDEGPVHAWVYVANRAVIDSSLLPEQRYLNHLLAARELYSEEYHQWLLQHPVVESDRGSDTVAFNSPRGLQFND